MLELKHISYSVREADETLGILKDISLTVDDHKLVVFTGPNGGGKTTLMRVILGLKKPDAGRVTFFRDGEAVDHLGIGYLPQYSQIDRHFPIPSTTL